MHRTQILLEDRQYERLKTLAEREGRSLSSLVRDAVSAFLDRRTRRDTTRLNEIAGIGEDRAGSGRDHDRILYGPRGDRT